jgi:hypothetical protein
MSVQQCNTVNWIVLRDEVDVVEPEGANHDGEDATHAD